jgi:Allophanate hydrolase subunit 2
MKKNKIIVLREGINSTFQDLGRNNFYHIGLPFSGAMDKRNYLIVNKLVGNQYNEAVIEFAYQGPLLKIEDGNINFAISGDVKFNIKKDDKLFNGQCYKTYFLSKNDEIDIISTNKSVYGYFAVSGGFELNKNFGSFSTTVRANVGSNNGNKLSKNEKFLIKDIKNKNISKNIEYINSKVEYIRILKGTNFDYFSDDSINDLTSKTFLVSKLSDRMGMRLQGSKIKI